MKKYLTIVSMLLLICPTLSFAQGKFLSRDMKWTQLQIMDMGDGYTPDSTFRTYEIVNDTMINGYLYYEVSDGLAFLRESLDSNIYVYTTVYTPRYTGPDEKLLYDFSKWNMRDSLYFFQQYEQDSSLFVIERLDYLLIKDKNYPLLENGLLYSIGFRSGYLTEYLPKPTCLCETKLLTFYRNGELLYNICDYSAIQMLKKEDYLNFVTTENGQIIFQLKEEIFPQVSKINIYSLQGTLAASILINNKNRIEVEHLSKGIYMYQLIDTAGKSVTTGKINLIK